jgi:integrase
MSVSDCWHKDPAPGDEPCKCGRGSRRLYPSASHGKGVRWQVRYRDPSGKQRARKFAERAGTDPNRHADAFDRLIAGQLQTRNYIDPKSGEVTLAAYAEQLRKARRIPNEETAADYEGRLRNHVYEGEPGSGLTPKGAPSIGQHAMGLLDARPSIVAAWAAAIPLSPSRARHVMGDVSYVFRVAAEDGIVRRDPLHAASVEWPRDSEGKARPWTPGQLEAMRAVLPERYRVLLDIGAGAGLRQGEMLALGTDDIDWLRRDDPRVHVRRQLKYIAGKPVFAPLKNRKVHSAPLSPELKRRLAARLEEIPAVEVTLPWHDPADKRRHGTTATVRLIVTTPGGRPVQGGSLNNTWRRCAAKAGVTPEGESPRADGCHALRHTFVSVQLRAGADVVRVAHWIGDSVRTVVETYAHFMPGGDDGDARAAVDAFLLPQAGGASARDVHDAGQPGR